jgi:tetratricopeptide (TPR) repeat protein
MRASCTRVSRISAVLAVSFTLGFTSGCHRDPNKEKQRYLQSGEHYAAEGKNKEAVIQLSNALKVDHNFADAHYQLSKVYLKEGAVQPAFQELRRTVDLQPGNIKARIDLGNLLLAGRAPDRAAEQANAILALQSNNPDAFSILAGVAASKGNRTEALAQIQHALAIDPQRAAFHATLGMIQASDPATAAGADQQLRKAVALDGKNINARIVLAALLQKKGDLAGALEQMKGAVAADPKNLLARATLADLYLRQNDAAQAEATYRQATDDLFDNEAGAGLLANYYIRSNQFVKGETAYAELVAKHPKSAPLKLSYARLLILNKDIPKAREIGAELAKTDSSLPEVAILNGMLLLNDGKTNQAFDTLQKAAKTSPDSVGVKLWLARAARAKGDMTTAQQNYQDAEKLNPRNLEAQAGLADISIQTHDFTTLEQLAGSAIAATPQASNPYLWRGIAEGSRNDLEKADADFHEAIKLDPTNSNAYLELAQLRLMQKKESEAKPLLEQALQYNPNSARALHLLASCLFLEKQPAQALTRVQEQIAKSPQNSAMYALLSDLQMAMKDPAAAVAAAEKAMQLNPNDSSAVIAYSRAQVSSGNTGAAIAKWQEWTAAHTNDAQAYTILASLREAQGDRDRAMDNYKKALSIQPDQPIAANNLAYLMVQSGQNLDVALSLAQIARRALPNAPSTADTLAWIYYQKGNYASGRDLLEDAVKADPNNASIHYHLGMIYAKLSNNTDAKIELKKASALAPNTQTQKDADKELSLLG